MHWDHEPVRPRARRPPRPRSRPIEDEDVNDDEDERTAEGNVTLPGPHWKQRIDGCWSPQRAAWIPGPVGLINKHERD